MKLRILSIAGVITCFLIQAQGADKYTDGNRPYEFGFSIEGEQHRHEKKDENGLIMGEFGFITADGVYHVTVYATDEQGRFKILSMKNIRVKPYPSYTGKQSTTSERQGHSLNISALPQVPAVSKQQPALSAQAPTFLPQSTTKNTFQPISLQPPGRSCSSCSIPTTSTVSPMVQPVPSNIPNQFGVESAKFPGVKPQPPITSPQNNINSPQQPLGGFLPISNSGNSPQIPLDRNLIPPPEQYPTQPQSPVLLSQPRDPTYSQSQTPSQPQGFTNSESPIRTSQPEGPNNSHQSSGSQNFSSIPAVSTGILSPSFPSQFVPPSGGPLQQNTPKYAVDSQSPRKNINSGRSPKRLDEQPPFGTVGSQPNSLERGSSVTSGINQGAPPSKPTLISAQMQIVDKNTDIHRLGPGESKGLPKGLTEDDMTHLLYTFNYTVGFHGHFEEGYTNGVKQGYYFVTGRNGVRTRIDYTADSSGFHPKISQEVLDLLSDEVPKPETEKDERYGLKGYEFKWLYYPIEDQTRTR